MNHTDQLETLDRDQLDRASGGQNVLSRAWDVARETFGYAGPPGASEAAAAIQPAANAMMLGPQARAKNNLIQTLASPTSSSGQVDAAFDRYHNGPGQKLIKHVQ
jgi:hypothetical protein